jgi:hypothetical protein
LSCSRRSGPPFFTLSVARSRANTRSLNPFMVLRGSCNCARKRSGSAIEERCRRVKRKCPWESHVPLRSAIDRTSAQVGGAAGRLAFTWVRCMEIRALS